MASTRKTTVLITGCTPGGIGHALAAEFHKRGCHVIATARNPDVLEGLQAEGFSTAQLDVTDEESLQSCREAVEKLTDGRLDILVNNAGRTHTIPALDMEIDDVRATYEANVFGPMRAVQAFIGPLMAARGLIVNISSTSAQVPYMFGAIYSSTKGALDTYSRALRLELRPLGVRVMVAVTGTVRSNIASRQHRSLPAGSLYQPVRDVFEWRLTFSQNHGTVSTESYARGVVDQALRGEGWFGHLIGGTPDWFWHGGMSRLVWLTTLMPRWLSENVIFPRYWKIGELTRRIQAAGAEKST
ncbi:1-acylglycerone phosphate reductase [Geosmithia morbida]|uniref:1-acylglycerone phosphate reductase n=1 Tax=Geosmithia morbida TaxID=1094350 RepID=A0A9P4YSN4_9HYPO|nr:1-acylglycerone phosphate reductase [Geosmithia morbida]KAF4122055.1 1-acylglycerone phosphate reductase [Geosmithia morbida]